MRAVLSLLTALFVVPSANEPDGQHVRGVTISCQTNGHEWGTDEFCEELSELSELGANWVAIHPYARIHNDGRVTHRLDPLSPPTQVVRPITEAHARGISILVVPHLAYWGSRFRYRGEIAFEDDAERKRFFNEYRAWITLLAQIASDADAFCIGSELDATIVHEREWREIIRSVRGVTDAQLVYGANWDGFQKVGFWDALDAIGVQAYFPLAGSQTPEEADLREGWRPHIDALRELHRSTGKPVVFTELGYNRSLDTARTPWSYKQEGGERAKEAALLKERCLRVALEIVAVEREWLRGVFLWKWFVGEAPGENFLLDTPPMRAVIESSWTR